MYKLLVSSDTIFKPECIQFTNITIKVFPFESEQTVKFFQ